MEEEFIDNMAAEAKSVEEFLGRYQQWLENGCSVARDVARRYLIIRAERDVLKGRLATACHIEAGDRVAFDYAVLDQLETLKAELAQAREGLRQIADAAASAPFWILADMARAALTPPEQEA